jgi:hypothetical protein
MLTMWRWLAVLLAAVWLGASGATAQERQTEHTVKLTPGQKPAAATIADMAWLAGHWTGDGLGGVSEEMWTAPHDGVMLGMYRLIRDGKPVFYELLTISEHEGSLLLRLEHFNPDLTGWEDKSETVDFPFVAKTDGRLQFAGLTFMPDGDRVTIYLAIRGKDGAVREEAFRMTRIPAAASSVP